MNINPQIEEVAVSDIKPSPYNPRTISKEAREGLKFSLEKFGMVSLLVVNRRNMQIIGGHQRFSVIKESGLERIPVVFVDVDDQTEKAMNITLNNPHISGRWTDLVVKQLEDLKATNLDEFMKLRFADMAKNAGVLNEIQEPKVSAKELDSLPTAHKCGSCGYEW